MLIYAVIVLWLVIVNGLLGHKMYGNKVRNTVSVLLAGVCIGNLISHLILL